ncbi:DsbA family protein [Pigmentiphaga sp. YJ18]|uniref:DsbA family protein n=1 Tax=Pigmentiphaga sp. YJ18 TaxID=3134907 RepID=UPI0031171644
MPSCDTSAGLCSIDAPRADQDAVIHYFGDPMCSWCWGLSPSLKVLEAHATERGIGFQITVGGLRAGGGDPWIDGFKRFLRKEWTHVAEATGQPFGFTLLDRPSFNYDTEPACRAIVVARRLFAEGGFPASSTYEFFSAVQRTFYVEGMDLSQSSSYVDACAATGLDLGRFTSAFASDEARKAAAQDFAKARNFEVRSFPTLLVERGGRMLPLSSGYATGRQMIDRLDALLAVP